jgi:acetylornithine/succinyldiaminopimelate/putrescine aminotransferase
MRLEKRDDRYVGRATDPDQIEIARQSGSYVYNPHGKKYVDFVMGWCVGNFGWGNPEIEKRVRAYRGPNYITPHQLYRPWVELAERLEQVAPGKLKKSFRATGGTEAVEIALQAAMTFTERRKFISVEDAYHGDSIAARCIGSPEFGKWFRNPLSAHRMKPPFDSRCADQVEKWLKERDVAAVIMEPVLCNRGVIVPEKEFMERLRAACTKYGTLLILDEVATGFFRTGKLFATEHFGVEPDALCLGKAITGGVAPMGATLMSEKVAEAMNYESSYYSTYGWHPLGVEAALGTLDYIDSHSEYLEENIREMGHYFVERLSEMNFREKQRISAKGLAIGVKFESEDYGSEIVEKAKENGLLLTEGENGFTLFPALTINRQTIDEGISILKRVIESI